MKKHLIASLVCLLTVCGHLFGQTADQYVNSGLANLASQDLVNANSNFVQAVALSPTDPDANVLVAVTRLLLLPQTPAGSNLLNGLNFSVGGRNIYNWTSQPPEQVKGGPVFPANYNSTNVAYFFRTNVIPLISASLANLANVTDTSFQLTLTAQQTGIQQVTLDYGDIQVLRALLTAAEFAGYTVNANNSGVILPQIVSAVHTNALTIQNVLSDYPNLLTLQNKADIAPSQIAASNAIVLYFGASYFIRNDRLSDDTNALFSLPSEDYPQEAEFRSDLSNALSSLEAPTEIVSNNVASTVYLAPYFSGDVSLNKLVPKFEGDAYAPDSLPDYTFGGILPDAIPYQIEKGFMQEFYSYAGIYTGNNSDSTNGVYDSNGYNNGAFAVYISTNGQATLLGYDAGDGNADNTAFFFFNQFTLDPFGSFNYTNSVAANSNYPKSLVNGYGSIDQVGDFYEELDYWTNSVNPSAGSPYLSIYLFGNEQPVLGPLQSAAGYYTGSFSGEGESGQIYAVVPADGEIDYVPVESGVPFDGGWGQFDSNNQFYSPSADGTVVAGTLNLSTFDINGIFTNTFGGGDHGTIKLSRNSKVNFDVPPVITTDLPSSVTLPIGNTVKFTLGVSGSAPLDYQWYFNNAPIPGATGSTLTVSNNLWSTTGQYQISAVAANVAGVTNSATSLVNVTLETNIPTLKITSPTSNQRWSNSVFVVTGTADDDLAVTNVYYSLNGSDYTNATSSDDWATWSVSVNLSPGSNTISAYAINEGGIPSLTNKVALDYVVSAPLTVQTSGLGTISPNYSNAVLQVGVNYTVTATPAKGFAFTDWTGGTGLPPYSPLTNKASLTFTMQSGLVLQANFTDTNKPYLKITNAASILIWSNAAYTVGGVATDDEEVASVNYSLNGDPYTSISIDSNKANWTAPLFLTGGTNTFSAYAVATNGNVSATNTVKIVYVISAPLTLQITGLGTISPNYSNALLRVGANYTMTATPAKGYVFTDWTGGTIEVDPAFTNKPTLTFTMQSGLFLQANFTDTNKPFLKITNVVSGMVVSSNEFTFKGIATDDVGVASISYSLNSPDYSTAPFPSPQYLGWSAELFLNPGTNVFSAYAVATNGNISATNTVKIVYVVSAPLTLQTSGNGTISPNYSNAVLKVGANYTMTATPAKGFAFTDWTGGTGLPPYSPLTNKAALTFTMVSNLVLQANFTDTNKPYLKITNAASILVWSNAAYTVGGVATDDEEVASVNYSLDGLAYTAIPINSKAANWSTLLALNGGTNTFSAYAVATNGNISATNTVKIVYVVSAPLTVQMSGLGTISPDYSNALLRVGANYTITATPAKGYVFADWTGGYLFPSSGLTNKATLTFTMQSGLYLQANLTDTNKPYLKITNTVSGLVLSNLSYTVAGLVTDDVNVASVNYSLNGATYISVPIFKNISLWSANVDLAYGTNTFAVYAQGNNGNLSATNSILIIREPDLAAFPIAPNVDLTQPQAQIAFDGTNYLVVFQNRTNGNSVAAGQFVSHTGDLLGSPLPLTANTGDDPPCVAFTGTNYLVAWANNSIQGAFVSPSGNVGPTLQLSQSTTIDNFGTMAAGNGVYFLEWADSSTSPDSIAGAIIDASGTNISGDFLISTNGQLDEAGQGSAAFDGTNFLAVWASASGKMRVSGQLIDASGNLVGSPIDIYTNTTAAGKALPCVIFDGAKYLVLFNIGVNSSTSSAYHILGRFVTTSGQVLTNQIALTSDAGPQIVAGAAFNGTSYLITWNQGLSPYSITTSATVNGRFFNANGVATSTEFPVFKTQNSLIPTWAPVLYDPVNDQFVLPGGLGKMVSAAPKLQFTNGIIDGTFILPPPTP